MWIIGFLYGVKLSLWISLFLSETVLFYIVSDDKNYR